MTRYRCNVCNVYKYDDVNGDPDSSIKPGTKPEDFPEVGAAAGHYRLPL
jgi:rubredoxin